MLGTRSTVGAVATLERLTGVYDADGGLAGELRYVIGKVLGRAHCSLCDITHGALRPKAAWTRCRTSFGVPIDVVHRNERSAAVATATHGRLPAVVAHTDEGVVVVLGPEELDGLGGDVDAFAERLRDALVAAGLRPGPGQTM